MFEFTVTPEFLLALIAGLLALALDYFPVLAKWYDAKEAAVKRQINAGLVIVAAVAIFVGQCFNVFSTNLVCTSDGALGLLYLVFLSFGINQGVHNAFKPTEAMRARMFKK